MLRFHKEIPKLEIKEKVNSAKTWTKTQGDRIGNWLFPQREEEEEEENRYLQKTLGIVLWTAFAAFLLASLPHVAYFFASLEPEDVWGNVSDYWWIVSYILAISIDVTSFLLSLNLAHKMRRATRGLNWFEKSGVVVRIAVMHWPFIILLVGFSWLVNFEHATEFHSSMLSLAESVQINLLFWQGSLYTLNPIVGSAFPVLAVAYTGMADDVQSVNKKKPVNATLVNVSLPPVNAQQNEQTTLLFTMFTQINEQQKIANEQNRLLITEIKKVVHSLPEQSTVNKNPVREQAPSRKKVHRSRVIHVQPMNDERDNIEQETEELEIFTSSLPHKQESVHVSPMNDEEGEQESVNDEHEDDTLSEESVQMNVNVQKMGSDDVQKERVRTALLNNSKTTVTEIERITGLSRGSSYNLRKVVQAEIRGLGITGITIDSFVNDTVNDK